jgi:hypothetical protein
MNLVQLFASLALSAATGEVDDTSLDAALTPAEPEVGHVEALDIEINGETVSFQEAFSAHSETPVLVVEATDDLAAETQNFMPQHAEDLFRFLEGRTGEEPDFTCVGREVAIACIIDLRSTDIAYDEALAEGWISPHLSQEEFTKFAAFHEYFHSVFFSNEMISEDSMPLTPELIRTHELAADLAALHTYTQATGNGTLFNAILDYRSGAEAAGMNRFEFSDDLRAFHNFAFADGISRDLEQSPEELIDNAVTKVSEFLGLEHGYTYTAPETF